MPVQQIRAFRTGGNKVPTKAAKGRATIVFRTAPPRPLAAPPKAPVPVRYDKSTDTAPVVPLRFPPSPVLRDVVESVLRSDVVESVLRSDIDADRPETAACPGCGKVVSDIREAVGGIRRGIKTLPGDLQKAQSDVQKASQLRDMLILVAVVVGIFLFLK